MSLLSPPSLTRLAAADLTYPEIGATQGTLPPGYRHVRRQAVLGTGDRVFERAAQALLSWEMQRAAGLRVRATDTAARPGATVALTVGLGRWGLVAPCQVVYVVAEPDRRGFGYGTLPGHPESGEESFVVSRRPDGTVVLDIVAFSRPASALTRAAGPLAHRVQDWATGRYLAAMQRIAAGA
jgi:uncharacterized protein (UPF0548 family)